MTRIYKPKRWTRWENLLKKEGFRIIYKDYDYWNSIPYALNEITNEEFVLAETFINSGNGYSIVTIQDIVANQDNLDYLRSNNKEEENSYENNPYEFGSSQYEPIWRKNSIIKFEFIEN